MGSDRVHDLGTVFCHENGTTDFKRKNEKEERKEKKKKNKQRKVMDHVIGKVLAY